MSACNFAYPSTVVATVMGESCIFISFMGFFTWGSVRGAPEEKWGKGAVSSGTGAKWHTKKRFRYTLPHESFGHQCCSFMLKSSLIAMYAEKRAIIVQRVGRLVEH